MTIQGSNESITEYAKVELDWLTGHKEQALFLVTNLYSHQVLFRKPLLSKNDGHIACRTDDVTINPNGKGPKALQDISKESKNYLKGVTKNKNPTIIKLYDDSF